MRFINLNDLTILNSCLFQFDFSFSDLYFFNTLRESTPIKNV